MDGMPDDLQFLPPDKEREEDDGLRKMLIESLIQLSNSALGRDVMRKKKVYPILRELHKWEPEREVKQMIESLVQILQVVEMEDVVPDGTALGDLNLEEDSEAVEDKREKDTEPTKFQVGAPPGYYLENRHLFEPPS